MVREKKCGACDAKYAAPLPAARKRLNLQLWRPKRKRGEAKLPKFCEAKLPQTSADFVADANGGVRMSNRFIEDRARERLANPGPGRTELSRLARRTEQWEAKQFDREAHALFALLRENKAGFSWADE